jgi:dTDP-4-dehydrorhamnose 3,5-epimerase
MILRPLELDGAFLVEIEPHEDHRGFYAQTFSAREFREHGLPESFVEGGISHNARRGTVRGMHMQIEPHAQAKLIRCTRGAIYDVIIDLRDGSPTRGQWVAVDLSPSEMKLLYVPEGFAHGFQTLEDDAEVNYQFSDYYEPEAEFGVRWNDPWFGIDWPIADVVISPRDQSFDDFRG